jgi:NTP pyrophosphatase (non-canonical NTP hydrolase)
MKDMSYFYMVVSMYTTHRMEHHGPPRLLDSQESQFRIACMQEELDEYRQACERGDLTDQADALADLVVFALGTAHRQGLPFDRIFEAVVESNLKKVPGMTRRGFDRDLIKPDGWEDPKHAIRRLLQWYEDNPLPGQGDD